MKLKHVSFKHVLQDFTYETDCHKVAIVGPSGAGKTTLLHVLCGLKPVTGEVETVQAAMAFQEPRLIPWLTARANLELVLGDQAETWLALVGLQNDGDKRPGELSGGMNQRLSLARALGSPGVLVLDEPFVGLDPGLADAMEALIQKRDELLLVTHDVAAAAALCEEIVLVQGPPLQVVRVYDTTRPGVIAEVETALRQLAGTNRVAETAAQSGAKEEKVDGIDETL